MIGWGRSRAASAYGIIYCFFFFLPSLSDAILKTTEIPALCDVISPISQLFVPHFATMSALMRVYLQHHINKQRNTSFEFFSVLLTFDRLQQLLRSYCYL